MVYLSAFISLGGAIALALVPHHKDRTKRLLQRGGAAAVFGMGLFGTLFALILS